MSFEVAVEQIAYESGDEFVSDDDGDVTNEHEIDDSMASDVRSDIDAVGDDDDTDADRRPAWLPFGDDDEDIRAANAHLGHAGVGGGGVRRAVRVVSSIGRDAVDEQIERVASRSNYSEVLWRKQKPNWYFFGGQRVEVRAPFVGAPVRVHGRRGVEESLEAFIERAGKTEVARMRGVAAYANLQQMRQQTAGGNRSIFVGAK
jgi:hypothetical protein